MRRGRLGPGHVWLQQVLYLLYICMEITAPCESRSLGMSEVRNADSHHDNTYI